MGIAKITFIASLTLTISFQLAGQDCGQIKKGLLKGKTYTAECDSMIVLDKKTYEGFYNKIFYYEAIIDNQDRLDSLMRAESKAKDVLIKNLDDKISIQGKAIIEYRSKIDTLYTLSDKSIKLNEKVIDALEDEKKKNKFVKTGLFAAGGICLFLIGIVVAGAL
jgi:hypothetical protein